MSPSASLVIAAILFAFGDPVLADEPVPIGEVVADPDAYHFRIVSMQGTVRKVQALPPYAPGSDTICYGAYTFTLEDDTGSLEVDVLGICGKPTLRKPDVGEGDVILLNAQILSPDHLTSASKGELKKLRVVANSIERVSPVMQPQGESAPNRKEGTVKPEGEGTPEKESGY